MASHDSYINILKTQHAKKTITPIHHTSVAFRSASADSSRLQQSGTIILDSARTFSCEVQNGYYQDQQVNKHFLVYEKKRNCKRHRKRKGNNILRTIICLSFYQVILQINRIQLRSRLKCKNASPLSRDWKAASATYFTNT